jgi:hypothetical protein
MKNNLVLLSILLLVGSLFVPFMKILNVKIALAYIETEIDGKKVRTFTGDTVTKNIGSDKASKLYGSAFWLTIGSILSLLLGLGFKTIKFRLQILAAIMFACVIGLLAHLTKLTDEALPEGIKFSYTILGFIYYAVLMLVMILPTLIKVYENRWIVSHSLRKVFKQFKPFSQSKTN